MKEYASAEMTNAINTAQAWYLAMQMSSCARRALLIHCWQIRSLPQAAPLLPLLAPHPLLSCTGCIACTDSLQQLQVPTRSGCRRWCTWSAREAFGCFLSHKGSNTPEGLRIEQTDPPVHPMSISSPFTCNSDLQSDVHSRNVQLSAALCAVCSQQRIPGIPFL